jgi:hypothetical protein
MVWVLPFPTSSWRERHDVVGKGASPSQHGVSEGLDIVPGASPQADVVKGVRDATSA